MKTKYFIIVIIVLMAAMVGSQRLITPKVSAHGGCEVVVGRCLLHSYFTDEHPDQFDPSYDSHYVLSPGEADTTNQDLGLPVSNVDEYVNMMRDFVYGTSPRSLNPVQDIIGAAFTIDIMLGKNGGDFGNVTNNGIDYARLNFGNWETKVRWYASQGRIDWLQIRDLPAGSLNSYGFRGGGVAGDHDTFTRVINAANFVGKHLIVFKHANGSDQLLIQRNCGNLNGVIEPLDSPPPPAPPIHVTGRIFDANTFISAPGSIVIETCTGPGSTSNKLLSNPDGRFDFTFPAGQPFCLRPQGPPPGYVMTNKTSPFSFSPPGSPNQGYQNCPSTNVYPASLCGYITYEQQVAGQNYINASPNGGNWDRFVDYGYDFAFYPAPSFSCDTVSINPNPSEINTPTDLKFRANVIGGVPGASYNYSVSLAFSPGNPGVITGYTLPSGPYTSPTITVPGLRASAFGRYNGVITVNFSGGYTGSTSCPFNINPPGGTCAVLGCLFVSKPYFQLSGGDIAAGISASPCTGWTLGGAATGTITAWNQLLDPGGTANKGAGTNLAAFALHAIDGFASAQNRPVAPMPPKGLSFANTAAAPNPTFGGGFTAGAGCPKDYFSTGISVPGPRTIAGDSIAIGQKKAVYVDGDVFITANITFVPGATTIDTLQSYYLVVRGNIYIDAGVTRLDGVYVAQPNGAVGGKIYTCYDPVLKRFPTPIQLNSICKANPLTVNGAFIAQELKLYRSSGSVSSPLPPAEQFFYTPATWLAAPDSIGKSDLGQGYDAITSLPPVL